MKISSQCLRLLSSYAVGFKSLSVRIDFLLLNDCEHHTIDYRIVEDVLGVMPGHVNLTLTKIMIDSIIFEFTQLSTIQLLLNRDNEKTKHYITLLKSYTGDVSFSAMTLKILLCELH